MKVGKYQRLKEKCCSSCLGLPDGAQSIDGINQCEVLLIRKINVKEILLNVVHRQVHKYI